MDKLIVSSSPHFNGGRTTQNIKLDVLIALVPAMVASVILFGFRAAVVILTCVATCVLSEYLCRRVMVRLNHGTPIVSRPGQGTLVRLDLSRGRRVEECSNAPKL